MQARTERIRDELDDAAKAKADAEAEAADIRPSLGDIDAERARILAEADQTAASACESRAVARNDAEVADLEARDRRRHRPPPAAALAGELQAQVGQHGGRRRRAHRAGQLDDATVQRLVEDFIAKVGSDG